MRSASHAGGVVFRRRNGVTEFLLVRSKDRTCRVLPKGHIEHGEDAPAAASREVCEETGYLLDAGPPLGVFTYETRMGAVTTAYFLMEAALDLQPGELEERFRDPRWFTIDEVDEADLPLPDGMRELLERALRAIA